MSFGAEPRRLWSWLGLVCVLACSRESEPATYQDCLLRHLKAGMSERAVSLVTGACRDKFPVVEAPLRSLPRQALDKLRGRFGPDPHLD